MDTSGIKLIQFARWSIEIIQKIITDCVELFDKLFALKWSAMQEWDFDGDEVIFFVAAICVGLAGAWRWYRSVVIRRSWFRASGHIRFSLAACPLVALAVIACVLVYWADPKYVVGHLDYQLLFFAGGAAWIFAMLALMPILGIWPVDDALDQANPGVVIVAAGAILGITAIYAGSNMGSGPTIWTTILPAFVASVAWAVVWFAVELFSRPSDAILIDHDVAGALRLGAFLLASGLILGRATAGDWTSWPSTITDFLHQGWIDLLLVLAAIVCNRAFKPTPARPTPSVLSAGIVSSFTFIAFAITYLLLLGPIEIGKHVITYEQYMQSP